MTTLKVALFALTFAGIAGAAIVTAALIGGTGLYGALLLIVDLVIAVSGGAAAAVFAEWLHANRDMLSKVPVAA